ncbi:hypothetical protein CDAR_246741 [Caerostris darwini]|uniref:Uncharacterized protein n=1 Tax=Caerostris darwini TaxID=1538125 RepID=A0AAV4T843_9ARAC|nr:hypothetical protein CDAR_246741 [Caerostris darwini]
MARSSEGVDDPISARDLRKVRIITMEREGVSVKCISGWPCMVKNLVENCKTESTSSFRDFYLAEVDCWEEQFGKCFGESQMFILGLPFF